MFFAAAKIEIIYIPTSTSVIVQYYLCLITGTFELPRR
jgi:hypothetical protein